MFLQHLVNALSIGSVYALLSIGYNMVYGILASQSCLLTDISDQLHEPARKVNTVKRLSTHLLEGPLPLRLPLISIP